jgi:hypothetical protein
VHDLKRYFLNVTLGCAAAREPNARTAKTRDDTRDENSGGGLSILIFFNPSSSPGKSFAPAG